MRYEKPALGFEAQRDLLLERGLEANPEQLDHCLRSVSYFRLSGYLHPYRSGDGESYVPGTTLERVWNQYTFDRQLRLIAMDAIERFEVDLRTRLVTLLASSQGPTGYSIPTDSST